MVFQIKVLDKDSGINFKWNMNEISSVSRANYLSNGVFIAYINTGIPPMYIIWTGNHAYPIILNTIFT